MLYQNHVGGKTEVCLAESKNTVKWEKKTTLKSISNVAMVTPSYSFEKKHILYFGYADIKMALSENLENWQIREKSILSPRSNYFDNHPLLMGSAIQTTKGIFILYYVKKRQREGDYYLVGGALLDKKYPSRILWRSDKPLWEQLDVWKGEKVYPMGGISFKENLIIYFGVEGDAVHAVFLGKLFDIIDLKEEYRPKLIKHVRNPIITPVLKHIWEANATFNTAAVYIKDKVHFVYRAMGHNNTSVLGYASSSDGINIDERFEEPIYVPTEPFECPGKVPNINYMSGGGYGGCEDPRITKIDDTLYMTYVAYNGIDPPRIALTSIKIKDFLEKNWKWAKPKIISAPGIVDKNCVIFPEKINGKFVIIHRVFPNILIDIVGNLDFKDFFLTGNYSIPPRPNSWDSRKLGAGAPPLKTKDGWLLIYQAVDDKDPGRYKIGAMLLDLNDPTKIICRPHFPVLEPTEWYENEGFKGGVAYPCGAVIKDNQLFVYYGGADTVICAATANLDDFLYKLKLTEINHTKPKGILHKTNHFPNKYNYNHIVPYN